MAKKKDIAQDPIPPDVEKEKEIEMVPVLFATGCISHWVPKAKE